MMIMILNKTIMIMILTAITINEPQYTPLFENNNTQSVDGCLVLRFEKEQL